MRSLDQASAQPQALQGAALALLTLMISLGTFMKSSTSRLPTLPLPASQAIWAYHPNKALPLFLRIRLPALCRFP